MEEEVPMTTTQVENKLFMGEVGMPPEEEEDNGKFLQTLQINSCTQISRFHNSQSWIDCLMLMSIDGYQSEESEEEEGKFDMNMLGDCSKLPDNVQVDRVKKNVWDSLKVGSNSKFRKLFNLEHVDAIICDSFWYSICRVFKRGQYIHHEEFFLDRIAANYVSFTLHDEFMGDSDEPGKGKKGKKSNNKHYKKLNMKDSFFKHFYNAIAQSVFWCLFFAFPKTRSKLNEDVKRELLDIFSELFTGTKIKSASFDHWNIETLR